MDVIFLTFLFCSSLFSFSNTPPIDRGKIMLEPQIPISANNSNNDTLMNRKPGYRIILSQITLERIFSYKNALLTKTVVPGAYFKNALNLNRIPLERMSNEEFITVLLHTKKPVIFAESDIKCDHTDWNRVELQILGDINIAVPVEIYDNGIWKPSDKNFRIHTPHLKGELLFTPGALLRGDTMVGVPPDFEEVVQDGDEVINQDKYNQLMDRRLTPILFYANKVAEDEGTPAIITVPGIGCGAFAGKFRGSVGEYLNRALQHIIRNNAKYWTRISCIYYDPYSECENEQLYIDGIKYRVRPQRYNEGKSQLSNPVTYEELPDDNFSTHKLFKIVAWDHVSYPGNDYFVGSRNTDDGVAAAATNSMKIITGVPGEYKNGRYSSPEGKTSWKQVVVENDIKLHAKGNVYVLTVDKKYMNLLELEKR